MIAACVETVWAGHVMEMFLDDMLGHMICELAHTLQVDVTDPRAVGSYLANASMLTTRCQKLNHFTQKH